jgi:hypothetical protein
MGSLSVKNASSKLSRLGIFKVRDLKVMGNEKGGWGVRKQATVRIWFRTVAIDVYLIFNVAVVFSSKYFRFLFVKLSLDNGLENRRGAPNC